MDRRISILKDFAEANTLNEPVPEWGTHATVWARCEPIRDGERWQAGEHIADKGYRFTIRWSREVWDVDPKDRVMFEGRHYDIKGVKELGRRDLIEITATARAELPA